METDWELHYGMGMKTPATFGAVAPAYMYSASGGMPSAAAETLRVDDLLDFTNHELFSSSSSSSSSPAAEALHVLSAHEFSSTAAAAGSPFGYDADNSSYSNYPGRHRSFTDEIYIPSEEVAELEWLSQFVEESFSDVPYPNYLAEKTMWQNGNNIHKARSQRSRDVGASSSSSSSASEFPTTKGKANVSSRKKLQLAAEAGGTLDSGGVRRCTHCASEKTPQWRTGPLGPKTLCNACGVRYKSGRLVPEYRPAASPTFVLTQHSNSHRKVVELRRQKELLILHHNENDASAADLPELRFLDYEIC